MEEHDVEMIKTVRKAIKKSDIEALEKLFEEQPDVLQWITAFGTWLHDAAVYRKTEVVLYLIQKGVDVNKHGTAADCGAITNVARKGYLDIVKILYENGAKLEVSKMARNPLFAAIYGGHYKVAKFLIDKGIDLTASYSIGKLEKVDAYEYARQFGQLEIADYIKEKLEVKKVH